jgi:hypothetical protein
MTLILRKPVDLDHGIVLGLERSTPPRGAGWFPSNLSCPQTRIIYPPIESTRMRKLKELRLYRDCCAGAAARPLATRFAARCMNDCSFTIVALAMLYRRPSALRRSRRVILACGSCYTAQLHRPNRFALSAILTTCALAVVAAVRATAGACTAPRPIASPVVSAPIRALP